MTECQGPSGPYTLPGNEPCPGIGTYDPGLLTPGGYVPGYILNNLGSPGAPARTIARGEVATVQNSAWPEALQRFFAWFSSAEHWKGIGLLVAAGVLGIVGLVIWSGHGGDTVRVATQTGMRMAA